MSEVTPRFKTPAAPKKKRKKNRDNWRIRKDEATRYHSLIVRNTRPFRFCAWADAAIDATPCTWAEAGKGADCAHIIRREFSATRCDLSNAWCLCQGHHLQIDNNKHEAALLIDRTVGLGLVGQLTEVAKTDFRVTFGSTERMYWPGRCEELKEMWEELRASAHTVPKWAQ